MKYTGRITVARCLCGEPVIGTHKQPQHGRFWCGECVGFVEAAIQGGNAFHGVLPESGIDMPGFVKYLEARLLDAALGRAKNVAAAARLLGLNRTTLIEKLRRIRADPQVYKSAAEFEDQLRHLLPPTTESAP